MEKVMIFIDGANLINSVKSVVDRIDIIKLSERLRCGRNLIRTYYFDGIFPADIERIISDESRIRAFKDKRFRKHQFAKSLYGKGIEFKFVPLKHIGGGKFIQKGVDVLISVEMLAHAFLDNYDVAILVSGDGDLAEVVSRIRDLGKVVEVVANRDNLSPRLLAVADRFIDIRDIAGSIRLGGNA